MTISTPEKLGNLQQHDNFLGKVFDHFSKPKARFAREATYGIQASGDTKLSSIVRAIEDDVTPIQTEKRLSRNIEDETLGREISAAILSEGARHVKKDTLKVPQFGAYAITSGLKRAFSAFGRLARSIARIVPRTEKVDLSQHLPGFAELLDFDDG